MIDYKIAIPSYHRTKTIQDKTLKFLEKHQINPDKVTIFVANEEEMEAYTSALQIVTGKQFYNQSCKESFK